MIRKLLRAALLALTLMLVACGGGTPAASSDPTAAPSGGTDSKPAASKPVVESDPTEAPAPSMAAAPTPSTSSGQSTMPAVSTDGKSRDVQDISGSLDGLDTGYVSSYIYSQGLSSAARKHLLAGGSRELSPNIM